MSRIPLHPDEALAWTKAMALFDRWPELDTVAREREVATLAATSPRAAGMLRSLLQAEAEAEGSHFLEERSAFEAITLHPLPEAGDKAAPPQAKVGHWTLDRQLGAGGMGRVWLAHRDDGMYEGSVAIKMLHESADSVGARERFAREGRVLARLSHPNIARLMDAGFLPDGQRYLVIEYVAGKRIDAYCDEMQLSLRERVRLFRQVCLAVAHAHANLVVHRDLKPANILVLPEGQVKLLDFGIAKLIEQGDERCEETALTRVGSAMTPEYASPEQIEGGDITTASDIYALGVVLYRLLCGASPYVATSASPSRLARAIVDTDPRPMTAAFDARMTAESDSGSAPAQAPGGIELRRELAGDLQQIVAKAMRKAAEERYMSVQALLDDLDAYLSFRPVSARPSAFTYLAGRFVRRNRLGVALASTALLALLASLAGLTWQARIAMREEARAVAQAQRAQEQSAIADREAAHAREAADRAAQEESRARIEEARAGQFRLSAEREAARAKEQESAAREQARKANAEAAKAVALKNFMVDIFRVNMPAGGNLEKAQNTTAKELLESGVKRVRERFGDRPDLRWEMLDTIGEIYFRLGDFDAAERLARERLELIQSNQAGTDKSSQMAAYTNLVSVLQARGDGAESLNVLDEQAKRLETWGPRAAPWLETLAMNRARILLATDTARAIAEAKEALRLIEREDYLQGPIGHVLLIWETLARAYFQIENYEMSLEAAQQARQIAVKLTGKGSARGARDLILLGQAQRALQRRAQAEESFRLAEEISSRTLGASNTETLFAKFLSAALRHDHGDAGSLAIMQATSHELQSALASQAWPVVWSKLELAAALYAEGRLAESEKHVKAVIAHLRASGEYRSVLARAITLHARLLAVHGDFPAAEAAAKEAAALAQGEGGDRSPSYLAARLVSIRMAVVEDHYAEIRYDPVFKLLEAGAPSGPIALDTQEMSTIAADSLLRRGEKAGALGRYLAVSQALEAMDLSRRDLYLQSRVLLGQGRAEFLAAEFESAHEHLNRAVKLREALDAKDSLWLAEARLAFADCLIAEGRTREASGLVRQAEEAYARNGPLSFQYRRTLERIKAKLVE